MSIKGLWQGRLGEGINIAEEYSDGTILAHYYSSDIVSQWWLMCQGEVGNPVLNAFITTGPVGSPNEIPWGAVTVKETSTGINVTLTPHNGVSFLEHMIPLYVPGTISPGTVINAEQYVNTTVGWAECNEINEYKPMYFYGSGPLQDEDAGGVEYRGRITVLEGQLTITDITPSGKYNPKITGLTKGQVITKGQTKEFACSMGPVPGALPGSHGGQWDLVNWEIFTKELGQICKVSAQVLY